MLSKEIQLEVNKGAMLPLMEEFYTIHEKVFILNRRLFCKNGGCDVGCHWWDVKES
jgi:organic radical activating enzyme